MLNFIAPVNQLGYGICGLNIIKFAAEEGIELAWHPIGQPGDIPAIYECLNEARRRSLKYDPKAPSIRMYHQFDLALHAGSPRIGYPIFELDTFAEHERHHLSNQDALFVSSRWAKRIIEDNRIKTDTYVVPFGVDRSIFFEPNEQHPQQERGETVFLNVGKWELRKGHDTIIEAFEKAFDVTDNVRLIMCCQNPFLEANLTQEWVSRYKNSKLGGKIEVFDQRLPTQFHLAHLMRQADVGVFPARAEGWNLDLLEMLSCGKHCIATDVTAHTEFVNAYNCHLIKAEEMELAFDAKWFYGQGKWAKLGEQQIEDIAAAMKMFHSRKQEGKLGVNEMGIETAKKFSWNNTVKIMADSVEQCLSNG